MYNIRVNNDLEIYKQRYETYRHLDKLRWQMLQIGIAVISAIFIFGKNDNTEPKWWVLVIVGLVLILLGVAMLQIGNGINKNGEVLRLIGNSIGDKNIPEKKLNCRSISFWIAVVMTVLGVGCCLFSIINLYIC